MNVVSSILYFIGEKIQRMNGIEEVRFSPSSGEISLLVAKHNADKPSEPILAQDIVSLPPAGTSLVGVSSEGNVAPITLPLEVSNGGTGVDSLSKLVEALPYADYIEERKTEDGWEIIKWHSGHMTATKLLVFDSITFTSATGGGYANKSGNAIAGGFIDKPMLFGNINSGTGFMSVAFSSVTTTSFTLNIAKHFNASATNAQVSVVAIGKWKSDEPSTQSE